MRTLLAALALATVAALAPTGTATAADVPSWVQPGQIEPPVREVKRLTVEYTERVARPGQAPLLVVEFNDGRMHAFRPCRMEDDRRCFWAADKRGNLIGQSFIAFAGRLFPFDSRTV